MKNLWKREGVTITMLFLFSLSLVLAGCGGGGGGEGVSSQVVSGVAAVGAPLAGEAKIKDSSNREKTTVIGNDGSFAFDVTDMKGPFILQATGNANGETHKLHSFADNVGTANINPLANAIVADAAAVNDPAAVYETPDRDKLDRIKSGLSGATAEISTKFRPMLRKFKADNDDPIRGRYKADHTGLDGLFDRIRITLVDGVLTIINRQTGAVIFTGQISDIKNGNFNNDENCLPDPGTVPDAPTGVTAAGGSGAVTVSWTAVGNATAYNIYWSTASGVTTAGGTKIAGVASPYVQSGLSADIAYYYIVTALNSAGESAASAEVSATTNAASPPPQAVPTAPTEVNATGGTQQTTISWTAVTGATSYNIYWSTTNGVTKANGTKIANVTSVTVQNGLADGATYYYIVTAVNNAGESPASVQVAATTLTPTPPPVAPDTPTGVTATGGPKQATISWGSVTGATSYNVYWSTTSSVTTATGTKIAGVTSPYVHTVLSDGTTYYYIVTAVNSVGESSASAEVSATTDAPSPVVPNAPASVSAVGGAKQVTISWSPVSGATSYNLYWSPASGVTTATGTKITGATSPYPQMGLADGTPYYYVVTAVNIAGESPASTQATATTDVPVPVIDGAALYGVTCQGCHGPLLTPTRPISTKTVTGIRGRGMDWGLSDAQLQAIINVLP